ncbi:MAG: alanine-phosphoribitol ligase [Cereibacter sphaeroides]|uniref:Alanine-phosphoribitol ligase n=1 Tax=Cereibacter sphaeroides TaxID=1063 RepID=A0A2W5TTM3_CERSP|nr:MAG: alanine-phosphoribitol ligase [Cereibacter sphaeroides]
MLEADFIIIGGGSAGCALASRLTEDADCTVILLEAGDRDRSIYIHLPVTYYKTTGPQFTWGYKTAPQVHQNGLEVPLAQARVLGGGSSINAQIYMRGTPRDYDGWRDDYGCAGWGYEDVLPFFIKSEDNLSLTTQAHGQGGPLKVSPQAHTDPLTLAWIEACKQVGMNANADFNSGDPAGCGLYQVTNRAGRRSSAAVAYLRPNMSRPNLKVLTKHRALRLDFDGRRAVGVTVEAGGQPQIFRARREVVLSSGAIGTPHLLMRSGIGSAADLRRHGVGVVNDLPGVGRNLQDHLDVFMISAVRGNLGYDRYKKLPWQIAAALQFAFTGKGPITSNVVEGGAFWWVDRNDPDPDVQFHFLAGSGVEAGISSIADGGSGCTLNAYLVRPLSRGTVSLRDARPDSPPVIDPNYLSHPDDLRKTVDAVRLSRQIMQQPALAPYIDHEHFPGSGCATDAQLEDFVRREARTGYHPVGTCRMGHGPDAVVDTELRVKGIDGLRIVDNSIMPRLVSANTNATAIMIGEKAAQMIGGNRKRAS